MSSSIVGILKEESQAFAHFICFHWRHCWERNIRESELEQFSPIIIDVFYIIHFHPFHQSPSHPDVVLINCIVGIQREEGGQAI